MKPPSISSDPHGVADVCLVLEGTYPYVQGGVSSWVHQIITEMPDLTFAILYLGSTREQASRRRYDIPSNVVVLEEVFLFEPLPDEALAPGKISAALKGEFYAALESVYLATEPSARIEAFWQTLAQWEKIEAAGAEFTFGNLCRDHEAWQLLLKGCGEGGLLNESFIDFFWTLRYMHLPVWIALSARHRMPRARMYHSISAGYAGLMGAIAARRADAPYLITEHGLYTKERIAEISQATWIYDPPNRYLDLHSGLSPFKQLWINLFTFLGHVSYSSAQATIALFGGNHKLQQEFGADPARLAAIPNGIDPTRFDAARRKRETRLAAGFGERIIIGFIGRVVPIKDVKTLIRAAGIVTAREPRAIFHIIGPIEENPEYYEECRLMAKLAGLEEKLLFLGSKNIREIIDTLDVCVLTSISEGLPLIILECYAAGVPCVCTDVGACRELIYGRTAEDKAIGPAGYLTGIGSPADTADALLRAIASPENVLKLGAAGRTRVERHYRQDEIMGIYRRYYTDHTWAGPQRITTGGNT